MLSVLHVVILVLRPSSLGWVVPFGQATAVKIVTNGPAKLQHLLALSWNFVTFATLHGLKHETSLVLFEIGFVTDFTTRAVTPQTGLRVRRDFGLPVHCHT